MPDVQALSPAYEVVFLWVIRGTNLARLNIIMEAIGNVNRGREARRAFPKSGLSESQGKLGIEGALGKGQVGEA